MIAQSSIPLTLADLQAARQRLHGIVEHTPLQYSPFYSQEAGVPVYLKLENLQKTGSFKLRGASNKIARLLEQGTPLTGVVAASAGNHAQGVASAAAYNNLPAVVVMPLTASLTKIRSCREMGAEVIQHGASLEEAAILARQIGEERGYTYLHPYDDWDVIAGQASLGLELLQDLPDLQTAIVPLGGGGLLGGVALALKLQNPTIRVIGVQSANVSPYKGFIQTGEYNTIAPGATTIADGIKVKLPGGCNSEIVRRYVDDVVTVDDNQTSEAIVSLLERTRTISEGAGAVGLAALLHKVVPLPANQKTVVVISGGNIDTTLVGRIINFGLVSSGRYLSLALAVPDMPGQLLHLLGIVAELGMNVFEVQHRRGELHVPVGMTEITLQIEARDFDHQAELFRRFTAQGYHPRRLMES